MSCLTTTRGSTSVRIFLIIALAVALIYTIIRLADVERQRYAMFLYMCPRVEANLNTFFDCITNAQPRTSWTWDLWYGLNP